MPSLSVLLPCYNAVHTLPEALDSLARQTFADFEVVAIDDGLADSTLEVLHVWAEQDPCLRAILHALLWDRLNLERRPEGVPHPADRPHGRR